METPHDNKLEVPRWVCALAIGLGTAALLIQAAIDIYQGINASMDRVALLTQAWQMALPTGFTLVFAAIGGCLLHAKRWIVAVVLYALVGCYMAFTATNSMDFMSNQTVAFTQHQMAKQTAAKDIAEIRNQLTLAERKEKHETLWRTYVSAKPADKDKVLAQIKEASSEPLALQQTDTEVLTIGVGGTANKYLGWRTEAIQEAKAFALPVLVMIGKALGITLGFAFWPSSAAKEWKESIPSRSNVAAFPESVAKLSKEEARADILRMTQAGARVGSGRELSERWGVGEGTVSKWLGDFRREGLIKREANGNARAIVASPGLNGRASAGTA